MRHAAAVQLDVLTRWQGVKLDPQLHSTTALVSVVAVQTLLCSL